MYGLAADFTLIVHFAFITFVVFGGLLFVRRLVKTQPAVPAPIIM